jgi:YesN/AraC family two-component response regulator
MHPMNGLDLIAAFRRTQPQQKCLMVSGTVDEHSYHNSPIKPDRFLAKPYQARQLVSLVKSLLA